jgi:hypothetical protein
MVFISLLYFACNTSPQKLSHQEIVVRFYDALNASNFEQLKKYTADSILIKRAETIVTSSIDELHGQFQYDSVFSPTIQVLEINAENNALNVLLSITSKRIQFLHDTAIVYIAVIQFKRNQVSRIEINDYMNLDLTKLRAREDSLFQWIDQNHPQLSGFKNDRSIQGAMDYVMAIELFGK